MTGRASGFWPEALLRSQPSDQHPGELIFDMLLDYPALVVNLLFIALTRDLHFSNETRRRSEHQFPAFPIPSAAPMGILPLLPGCEHSPSTGESSSA